MQEGTVKTVNQLNNQLSCVLVDLDDPVAEHFFKISITCGVFYILEAGKCGNYRLPAALLFSVGQRFKYTPRQFKIGQISKTATL